MFGVCKVPVGLGFASRTQICFEENMMGEYGEDNTLDKWQFHPHLEILVPEIPFLQ